MCGCAAVSAPWLYALIVTRSDNPAGVWRLCFATVTGYLVRPCVFAAVVLILLRCFCVTCSFVRRCLFCRAASVADRVCRVSVQLLTLVLTLITDLKDFDPVNNATAGEAGKSAAVAAPASGGAASSSPAAVAPAPVETKTADGELLAVAPMGNGDSNGSAAKPARRVAFETEAPPAADGSALAAAAAAVSASDNAAPAPARTQSTESAKEAEGPPARTKTSRAMFADAPAPKQGVHSLSLQSRCLLPGAVLHS
jgi:hypothetical protein